MAQHVTPLGALHTVLIAGALAVLVLALVLEQVPLGVCLLLVMLAPVVTVVGYEAPGHRQLAETIASEGALG